MIVRGLFFNLVDDIAMKTTFVFLDSQMLVEQGYTVLSLDYFGVAGDQL